MGSSNTRDSRLVPRLAWVKPHWSQRREVDWPASLGVSNRPCWTLPDPPALPVASSCCQARQHQAPPQANKVYLNWSPDARLVPLLGGGLALGRLLGAYIVRLREAQVHKTTTGQSTRSWRADLTQSDDGDYSQHQNGPLYNLAQTHQG